MRQIESRAEDTAEIHWLSASLTSSLLFTYQGYKAKEKTRALNAGSFRFERPRPVVGQRSR